MDEETQPPDRKDSEAESVPSRTVRIRRLLVRALAVVVAILAAAFVAIFTIDLGPQLREQAEIQGSRYMERPMHIGRLSAKLTPGEFLVENLVIEGLTPTDRPFLTAKTITVKLPWWTVFSRKLVIESIAMTDWNMTVETWPGGRHSFPKVTPKNKRQGPSPFTTTLRSVVASRGQFTYQDHGTPWSTVARDLAVQLHRSEPTNDYRGGATFSNGTPLVSASTRAVIFSALSNPAVGIFITPRLLFDMRR